MNSGLRLSRCGSDSVCVCVCVCVCTGGVERTCITLAAKGLGIPVMGVIRPKCVREKLAETGRSALAAPDLLGLGLGGG